MPFLSSAPIQRGCLPRPDQVSDGRSGFRYFGCTFGYGRRDLLRRPLLRPLSWAKRRFNSCFSASIFIDRIARIFSCKFQSSSTDMDSRLLCFMTVSPNHDLILDAIIKRGRLVEMMARPSKFGGRSSTSGRYSDRRRRYPGLGSERESLVTPFPHVQRISKSIFSCRFSKPSKRLVEVAVT